jgi:uncharacterized alpha-E superfamily protein
MLLSRVADHLYWMSRYLERAEHTARVLDVSLNLMLEQVPAATERRWQRLLRSLHIAMPPGGIGDAYSVAEYITADTEQTNSIISCINAARENAQHIRELISTEMYEQLNYLYHTIRRTHLEQTWEQDPSGFFRRVKEGSHTFQGITDSTMTRGEGWQFIQIGRYIERSMGLAELLDYHYREFADEMGQITSTADYLDWVGLLKSCTAFEAYLKAYTADLRADRIAEFLLLNSDFPHSVCFCAVEMQNALTEVATLTEIHSDGRLNKLAGRLRALLEYGQIDEIMDGGLHTLLQQVRTSCNAIHGAIYHTYIEYPIDRELLT